MEANEPLSPQYMKESVCRSLPRSSSLSPSISLSLSENESGTRQEILQLGVAILFLDPTMITTLFVPYKCTGYISIKDHIFYIYISYNQTLIPKIAVGTILRWHSNIAVGCSPVCNQACVTGVYGEKCLNLYIHSFFESLL